MTKRKKIVPTSTTSGTWRVRWTQKGKRYVKTFSNKAKANAFCRDLNLGRLPNMNPTFSKSGKKKNHTPKKRVKTFADLADKFMVNHVMVKTKHSTQRNYDMQLRNQILPILGNISIKKLHLRDLDDLVARLAVQDKKNGELDRSATILRKGVKSKERKKLSPKMQRDCICLVLAIVNYCYEREYIDKNPFRKFKLPKIPASRVEYLTGEEVEKFLNCLLYTSPSPRDRTRSRMPSSA